MTSFDKALEAIRGDDDKATDFYNLFLTAQVYVPTTSADEEQGGGYRRLEQEETIRFLVIHDTEGAIIPVFDSVERLADWAGHDVRYIVLAGHVLVNSLHEDARMVLNPGDEHGKLFDSDELTWLRAYADPSVVLRGRIMPDERVVFRTFDELDPELQLALDSSLSENPEVATAYVGEIEQSGTKACNMLIVLDIGDQPDHVLGAIAKDVGVALCVPLGHGTEIDVMRRGGANGAGAAIRASLAAPVYVRPTHEAPAILQ